MIYRQSCSSSSSTEIQAGCEDVSAIHEDGCSGCQ